MTDSKRASRSSSSSVRPEQIPLPAVATSGGSLAVPTQLEKLTMSTTEEIERLVKAAESAAERGDLDSAERYMDTALAKAKKATNNNIEDDWSEEADSEADGNNASLDDGDNNDGDYEDDEDDEEDGGWRRASRVQSEAAKRADPAGSLGRGDDHQNMGPVSFDRTHRPTTHPLDAWPTTAKPERHKFDARVDFVQDRDGVSRTEAMSRARNEFFETYQDYQNHLAQQSTSAQRVRRGGHFLGKSAPTTYEDLVSTEMRKGVTMEVAGQRVMQQHGSAALRNRMFKNYRSMEEQLIEKAQEIIDATGCKFMSLLGDHSGG
jgi:hypothetical protein